MGQIVIALAVGAAVVIGLSLAPLSISPRGGILLVAAAALALVSSATLALIAAVAVLSAFTVDAVMARARPVITRRLPTVLARCVPSQLEIETEHRSARRVRVRQPMGPDLSVTPPERDDHLEATLVARRRGHHEIPPVATRVDGPLGLACWFRDDGETTDVVVYPDLPAARRLALSVRKGRFRDPGRITRGPLGLGTDFESIREYLPDDDVRQINWSATQRTGRPMSNQFRIEQDRDIICVVDTGRLMAAPIAGRTRLDAALDAVAAVAYVADELGDRAGVLAFDEHVRRHLRPRRRGSDAVVRSVYDLEPRPADADYQLAFHTLGGGKRAFVIVFTDLLDEAAASALVDAVPVLTKRHAVAVASCTDPDLANLLTRPPGEPADVFAAVVALDVLDARSRVTGLLRRTGAAVIEAPPDRLAAACVSAYLNAKSRALV
ncbi:MAG: DUF58 domain-containing protein [Acidimicrobiia bacterium]